MFNRIRAVHIAVNSIAQAAKDYEERFGFKLTQTNERPQDGVRNAFLPFGNGDSIVEFLEPMVPGQGGLAKFLEKRGEGVYMMAWEVDSIDVAIKELKAKGVTLLNSEPEARAKGANVFIHPKFAHGVLIELIEKRTKI
ncbi:MAG: VOC family protein [Dehalococcoidales bacterium]|nr:VOC family protein [Dehalococcoidales bacterium]